MLSQIKRGMLNAAPNLDWQLSLHCSKWLTPSRNSQVSLKFTGVVELDQRSKSTHAIYSHHCVALPLSPNLSLSVSLSLFLAFFPIMIYLYSFHIKTSWFTILIIMDCNKLSEDTTLFHLGDCLQYIFSHVWYQWVRKESVTTTPTSTMNLRLFQN
jgi:hypothetical protein